MINHARTLLLNRDGNGRPDPTYYMEEYVDPSFAAIKLPSYLQELYETLIGSSSGNAFANYRLRQYMLLLHSTEFQAYVYDLDPRVTYLTNRSAATSQNTTSYRALNVEADNVAFYFIGEASSESQAMKMYTNWAVEAVTPTFVRVIAQNGNKLDQLVSFSGGMTSEISVPNQKHFAFRIVSGIPTGDLTDLLEPLTGYVHRSGFQLFSTTVEPFKTFGELWNKHNILAYRLSGLLLANVYRIEGVRLNA